MPPIGDALRALRTTSFAGAVWGLRWQAPEVTLALTSQQPKDANAPAELVRFRGARLVAQCRLGQGLTAIAGLVSTLAAADTVGVADVREAMLLELAALAAPVGLPGAAVTAASLVLDSDEATPLARGAALLRLARSLTDPRHRAAVHDALGAAELVYSRCAAGQADTVGLAAAELRAVVPLHTARVARRDGEGERALAEVRRGIALLADTERDSGLLRARLCLEEVSVLLDLGDQRQACERAEILLEQPIRALAAGPASWLALTLAARVHGPAGRPARTEICLRTAERLARRHRLDLPLGQALTGLAQLCEQSQRPSDALRYLREAQSLGLRRAGQQTDARTALVGRFGSQVEHAPRVNADRLACWLASAAPTTRETAALPRATHSSTAEPIDVPASLRFDSDVPAGLSVQSPATSTDPSAARVGPVATQQSTASSAARVALPTSAGPALAELTETTDRLRAPRPESETSAMGVDVDPMPWSDFAPARGADATAPRPARGRRRAPEISDTSPQRPAETSASARSSSAARHGGLDHGRTGSGRVAGPSLDTGYPSDLWTSSGSAAAAGRACIGDPMADLAPEPEMHDGSLVGWAGQLADPTPIRMARSARSGVTVDTGGAGDEGDEVVDSGHLGTAEFTSDAPPGNAARPGEGDAPPGNAAQGQDAAPPGEGDSRPGEGTAQGEAAADAGDTPRAGDAAPAETGAQLGYAGGDAEPGAGDTLGIGVGAAPDLSMGELLAEALLALRIGEEETGRPTERRAATEWPVAETDPPAARSEGAKERPAGQGGVPAPVRPTARAGRARHASAGASPPEADGPSEQASDSRRTAEPPRGQRTGHRAPEEPGSAAAEPATQPSQPPGAGPVVPRVPDGPGRHGRHSPGDAPAAVAHHAAPGIPFGRSGPPSALDRPMGFTATGSSGDSRVPRQGRHGGAHSSGAGGHEPWQPSTRSIDAE